MIFMEMFSPFMLSTMFMPSLTFFVVVITVGVLAVIWREGGGDERDAHHRSLANRLGFLVGSIALLVGIVVHAFQHVYDPWLFIALVVMIATKLLARMYYSYRC